jgi:hypothetical protein
MQRGDYTPLQRELVATAVSMQIDSDIRPPA